MAGPYGYGRNAAMYYQYGGVPFHYQYNWDGLPPGPSRAADSRGLGDSIEIQARYRKDLKGMGDYATYPAAMSMESGRRSVLHSGPEGGKMSDGLGFFGSLSSNEKRMAMIAVAGIAGFLLWKKFGKK